MGEARAALVNEIAKLQSEKCGACHHWMKNSCTPEKEYRQVKSVNSYGCATFSRNEFTAELIAEKRAELENLDGKRMRNCQHEHGEFQINQQIMSDSSIRYLEISGKCPECGKQYKFQCRRIGSSPWEPTVSIDQIQIQLPVLMEGEKLTGKTIAAVGDMPDLPSKH